MHINNESKDAIASNEIVDKIFNSLENELLDKKEITLDFTRVTFISVYYLGRLEQFVDRARELGVSFQIINILPSIYKVFQVAKVRNILEICC